MFEQHDELGPGENPYAGYLELADEFMVTTGSISMAHEAAGTGKPLHLFDLPAGGGPGCRGYCRLPTRPSGPGRQAGLYACLIKGG